jgi:hypothetical protein
MDITITPTHTRSGDAQVASWKPHHLSGTQRVFAHDDGGVTLEMTWPHRPSDRISYMREEWDTLVAFVERARDDAR